MKSDPWFLQEYESSVVLVNYRHVITHTTMMNWNYWSSRNRPNFLRRDFDRDKRNCTPHHSPIYSLFLQIKNMFEMHIFIFKCNGITFSTKTSIVSIEDIVVGRLHALTKLQANVHYFTSKKLGYPRIQKLACFQNVLQIWEINWICSNK